MAISPAEARRLADHFIHGADQTHTPQVQAMIAAAIQSIKAQFERLPVRVKFVDHDPYPSYQAMRDQVLSSGELMIWKGASDVPMWDPLTNWQARAVHDWDHISRAFDFTMGGEYEGFRVASAKQPQLAPLYLSEIALQAGVANAYGDFATAQKIVLLEPDDFSWATGLTGLPATASPGQHLVSAVAMMLATLPPEQVALHLGALGASPQEGLALIEAGRTYNALVQGQMDA